MTRQDRVPIFRQQTCYSKAVLTVVLQRMYVYRIVTTYSFRQFSSTKYYKSITETRRYTTKLRYFAWIRN